MTQDSPTSGPDRAALMRAEYAGLFGDTGGPHGAAERKGRLFLDICDGGPVTRKRLIETHGIRPGTVSTLVLELIDQGLVSEERPRPPYQQGRPEILLRPVPERIGVIVVYVISQEFRGALVDLSGRVLCDHRLVLEPAHADNDGLLTLFGDLIATLREQATAATEIVGVAFSLPGIVDSTGLRWLQATSRWPAMTKLALAGIAKAQGIPVTINKALNSELRARLARRADDRRGGTLVVHWGYGIGAAFALDGQIIGSSRGQFGEIGHWTVAPDSDTRCLCGQTGCLETKAAMWALMPEIREVFPDAPTEEWRFEAFLRDHDITQVAAVKQATSEMVMALRNLAVTLFPQRMVLTGPFAQDPKVFAQFMEEFGADLPAHAPADMDIRVGRPGPADEIIGASLPLLQNALHALCSGKASRPAA